MDRFSQQKRFSDGTTPVAQGNPGVSRGTAVVFAFLLLASALGAFAVWFQWEQTRRCLDFFGPEIAAAIQSSPTVEIWHLGSDGSRVWQTVAHDVSKAPGLVHLRRGLIEDVNYAWDDPASGPPGDRRLPAASWDIALVFSGSGSSPVMLAVALDSPGALTVVGRPGRVTLGRLGAGLAKWVRATSRP
jgi:hypothetical protein